MIDGSDKRNRQLAFLRKATAKVNLMYHESDPG